MQKLMKLELKIALTTLLLVNLSHPVYAGTTLQSISKTMVIIDLEEERRKAKEALERYEREAEEMKGAYVFSSSQVVQQP
jgi:hypothetical protein